MKLYFKQCLFSWFDSYDIYNEDGTIAFTVEGQLSWGHCLHIYDASYSFLGQIKERVFTILPKLDLYRGESYIGSVEKDFTFFIKSYTVNFNQWQVEGDFLGWNYQVLDSNRNIVATIDKELFHLTDTYTMVIVNPGDAFYVLAIVLAIDIVNCS